MKSEKVKEHVTNLIEVFNALRKFRVKLKSKKCVFRVVVGKFLGFMVSQRGIKTNPEKFKTIMEMKPPSSVKVIYKLTSRVAALNYFMFRVVDRCLPFFKLLKKINNFEWVEECQ